MDSGSTCNIIRNPELVTDVRHCGHEGVQVHSNGGTKHVTKIADHTGFRKVWYDESSIANKLSLAALRRIFEITMDISIEAAFLMHRHDGSVLCFVKINKETLISNI